MSDGYNRRSSGGSSSAASTTSLSFVQMPAPSGDTTGATDTANFAACLAKLPTTTIYATPSTKAGATATFRVGTIMLAAAQANVWNDQITANNTGTPYYFGTTGTAAGDVGNIGPFVSILGPGHNSCVISYIGSGDCIRAYNTVFPSSDTFDTLPGFQGKFDGFTIDGSLSSSGACGFHAGDTEGCILGSDLWVTNFAGGSITTPATASKGIWWDNAVSWTENVKAERANLYNNTIGVYFSVTTGDLSFMYSDHEYKIYGWPNQYGVMLNGGANVDQGSLVIRGNFKTSSSANAGACLAFGTSSSANNRIADGRLDIQVETNGGIGGGSNFPLTIKQTSAFYQISRCYGILSFGNAGWQSTNMSTSFPVWFEGVVHGDLTLAAICARFYPWRANGLLGWTFDDAATASTGTTFNLGNITVARVYIPHDMTIANVIVNVTATGTTLTTGQNFGVIYDSSGNLLAQTADQTTNWGSTGAKIMALNSSITVNGNPGTYLWVGILVNASASPSFARLAGVNNPLAANSIFRFARTSNGGNTTPPSVTPGFSTSAPGLWAGIS